ncbi:MAG: WD40 repeat domain-containing protein [Gemmataceae bacterium]|nr:WD40 repeat domain-containing protein [Gemmataceae bacterium]
MSTFRILTALTLLAAVSPTWASAQEQGGGPRPVASDPDDVPLPAGSVARLGTSRFRNGGSIYDFAFSPDGKVLATAGSGNNMRFWDAATGKMLYEFPEEKGRAQNALFSPDGRHLISAAAGRGIQVWAVANRQEVHRFGEVKDSIRGMAVSPDGKILATAHWGGAGKSPVLLWDLETGKRTAELKGGQGGVESLAFSPNGRLLAVTGYHRGVEIWEVATAQIRQTFTKHASQPSRAVFTPDGKGLIVTARQAIHAWDLASEKQLRLFTADKQLADGSLALSPDGRLLATASLDRMVRLWDIATGEELGCFAGHQAGVMAVAFSRDGKHLVSGSGDSTALVWEVRRMLSAEGELSAKELDRLWVELGDANAAQAFKAVRDLLKAPGQATTLIRTRLTLVKVRAEVQRLLRDLDSPGFAEREKATAALEKLGHAIVPDLKRTLEGKLTTEARARRRRAGPASEGAAAARRPQQRAPRPALRRTAGDAGKSASAGGTGSAAP